ncbi:hypothetical protein K8T06_16170, partial [bacterium]|nr:hypothetical protein [bacterium]
MLHHVDDPAIFMHVEANVENCDFTLNGVGIAMICVSSADNSAEINGCTFEKNFIGIVALEKDHLYRYCTFKENYLTGIAFDKGSRTVACENLFIGNGILDASFGLDNYKSGVLSDFATTAGVPLIQTPFIFNNTFASNFRAMSISDFDYRSQYMNRPIFFNNIIDNETASVSPIWIGGQDRCDLVSLNNCFNLSTGTDVIELENSSILGVVMLDNLEMDPLLQIPSYTISGSSPCIDQGLHLLEVGITSLMNYPDYGRLDIGYHYPLYTGNVPDPPTNLRIVSGPILEWDPPSTAPNDYLVIIELDDGSIITAVVSHSS